MNAIFLVTGIASAIMFMFFFILPAWDKAKVQRPRKTVRAARIGSSAKTAH